MTVGVIDDDRDCGYCADTSRVLADLVKENRQLKQSAKAVLDSLPKHYQGFPGKLDWPEIHALKQALGQENALPIPVPGDEVINTTPVGG